MYMLGVLPLDGVAVAKWTRFTDNQREALERTLEEVLMNPRKGWVHRIGGMTKRFDQGYRTYDISLIASDGCLFVMCAYDQRVPAVLDIIVFDETSSVFH